MLLAAVVIAGAIFLLVLVLKPDLARKLVRLVSARLPARLGARIETAADQALQGLAPLSNPSIALRLGLWSLATWTVNSLTVYLLMLAFNLSVTPVAAVVVVVGTNLSMAVPSAPGYVGPFEAATVGVLTLLGQPVSTAQTFAIVYHFIGLVPVATIGVIAAIQQGVGLAVFRGKPPEPEPESPAGLTAAPKQATSTAPTATSTAAARDERC
jgi:uncharacterized membrane protein YbhN (UPF0104 family)